MNRLEIAAHLLAADCTGNGLHDIAKWVKDPNANVGIEAKMAINNALVVADALLIADWEIQNKKKAPSK